MDDKLIRGVVRSGSRAVARVVAAVTTGVAVEAARRHAARAAAAVALGRATTAGLLFATLSKSDDERVTLQILGNGPLGSVTVDAQGGGWVRGFVKRPGTVVAAAVGHRVALGRAVGRGTVQVIRDLGLRDQYRGSTALVSGEIDEDLESYLIESEQVESALGCDVVLAGDGVAAAGGVLVQTLPGGDVALVARTRGRMREGTVHAALLSGVTDVRALAEAALGVAPVDVQEERPVTFRCGCSRDRVAAALALVGEAELRAMIDEDGGAEVTCNFCGERYRLGRDDLARLLGAIPRA